MWKYLSNKEIQKRMTRGIYLYNYDKKVKFVAGKIVSDCSLLAEKLHVVVESAA